MDNPNITLSPKCDVIRPTGFKDMGRDRPKWHILTTIDRHLGRAGERASGRAGELFNAVSVTDEAIFTGGRC